MERNRLMSMTACTACMLLLAAGCSKMQEVNDTPTTPRELQIAAGIMPGSEQQLTDSEGAAGTASLWKERFEEGDEIMLTVTPPDGQKVVELIYREGTPLKWDHFAELGEKVRFAGCYPDAPLSLASQGDYRFNMELAAVPDLLLAPAVEARQGDEQVSLRFYHAMHRLTIAYKSSDGSYTAEELAKASVVCTARSTCFVDLRAGVLAPQEAEGQMTYASLTGQNATLLIVPQPLKALSLHVTIGESSGDCTFPGIDDVQLEGGKYATLTIDCRKKGFTITISEIADWGNQGDINGQVNV